MSAVSVRVEDIWLKIHLLLEINKYAKGFQIGPQQIVLLKLQLNYGILYIVKYVTLDTIPPIYIFVLRETNYNSYQEQTQALYQI